jgi:hypothetical protein
MLMAAIYFVCLCNSEEHLCYYFIGYNRFCISLFWLGWVFILCLISNTVEVYFRNRRNRDNK